MTRKESASQLRWFFTDYAATPSDRTSPVPDNCWGGSDTLNMAATFFQRDIFVVESGDETTKGRYWKYHPVSLSIKGRVVASAKEYPICFLAFIDEPQATNVAEPQDLSLVLRYGGSHYSALLYNDGVADP